MRECGQSLSPSSTGEPTAEQVLRLDNAVPMRWWLNDQHARIMRGEPVDMARVLTVSEAFARLLPPAVLATPPQEARSDPRETMLATYMEMRARGALAGEGYDGLKLTNEK